MLNAIPSLYKIKRKHHFARSLARPLGGHTNTERGFLPTLATKIAEEIHIEAYANAQKDSALSSALRALKVDVSTEDHHPLVFV